MDRPAVADAWPGLNLIEAPGNRISLGRLHRCIGVRIEVSGRNNIIEIEDGVGLSHVSIQVVSDNNLIRLGRDVKFCGRIVQKLTDGNEVSIGAGTSVGRVNIINGEGRAVRIGADCMLSFDIDLRTTDSHAIEDAVTGARLNAGADIEIGDHVWIAARAAILKGVSIASGCVVALNAVVTRSCEEEQVVLAGNPARIVRRGIRWTRPLVG